METQSNSISNDAHWAAVKKRYQLVECIGKGTFGRVVKAIDHESGRKVAIKQIKLDLQNKYYLRCLKREILNLRKLSSCDQNIFTNKLLEIILPETIQKASDHDTNIKSNDNIHVDMNDFTHLFLVLEYEQSDLLKLLKN